MLTKNDYVIRAYLASLIADHEFPWKERDTISLIGELCSDNIEFERLKKIYEERGFDISITGFHKHHY